MPDFFLSVMIIYTEIIYILEIKFVLKFMYIFFLIFLFKKNFALFFIFWICNI